MPAVLGLALGNATLLVVAGVVLLVLIRARDADDQTGEVATELGTTHLQRAKQATAHLTARLDDGPYLALAHQALPEPFQLADGTNLHLVAPGQATDRPFRFASPRRGAWTLEAPALHRVHPLQLAPDTTIAQGQERELTVEPVVRPLRTVKGLRGRGRDRLGEDRSNKGPASTEFQEIREYVKGDPLKFVNWKATAKASTDELELQVNTFEPEARKNVWFFLDLDQTLEVGTTVNTALEDGIDITLALVHHFLGRGHRVGGATYNGTQQTFYPDAGSRQELTIARGLSKVAPGTDREGLPSAVERVKGFLARERPLIFVVTRPEVDTEALLEGVRRIHTHTHTARRATPVHVLAPEPPAGDATDALAQAITALETRVTLQEGGTPYLRTHRLKDGAKGLERALAKGVMAR